MIQVSSKLDARADVFAPLLLEGHVEDVVTRFATSHTFFHSYKACAGDAVLRLDVLFSGRMLWFSGMPLVAFALSVRSNRGGSQVWRVMFSRPYR
jgi:hypothetical protein